MKNELKQPWLWITAILSALIFTSTIIYILLHVFSSTVNLTSYLYQNDKTKDEYLLEIPDYWEKTDLKDGFDISFTGNNYEYMYFTFKNKNSGYDFTTYGSQRMIVLKEKYVNNFSLNPKIITKNGLKIYLNTFNNGIYKYAAGFVDNNTFITDFEYRIDSKSDINNRLEDILTKATKFQPKKEESTSSETKK